VTAQVFAKPLDGDQWQWYLAGANDDTPFEGDLDSLVAALPSDNTRVTLLLPGQQFVSAEVELDAKQRRHAAKLVPFELEDELCSSVDQTHFSFSAADGDRVSVLYGNKERCEIPIKSLDDKGCDVRLVLPDYLFLPWSEGQVSLFYDGDILFVRNGEHRGFAIEAELAQTWLLHSQSELSGVDQLNLIGPDEESVAALENLVPADLDELDRDVRVSSFWHLLPLAPAVSSLNLRRGALSRQLPYKNWWALWQFPVYIFAAAFVVSILVNFLAYRAYKADAVEVREATNAVYLDAVPNGRLGDVERMLESKLKGSKVSVSQPSNMVFILSKLAEALEKHDAADISSLNYNGEQRSLQVTIQVDALNTLSTLRETMKEIGLESESPRTSALNDRYQARMTVRETP
jgi:general secretion pathway protein L